MRGAPPIEVAFRRREVWCGFVCACVIAMVGGIAAWAVSYDAAANSALGIAVLLVALSGAVIALAAGFPRRGVLRWTGLRWQLEAERDAHAGPAALDGDVDMAIDLGPWMLLRFTADSSHRRRVTWLPLQRRGLEADWHALRCAVYGARPVPVSR